MRFKPPHIVFFLLVVTFSSSVTSRSDLTTLLKLRAQWGNPPALTGWNKTSSPCSWPEVNCNKNGTVTVLNLNNKNITEPIPESICELKGLEDLELMNNSIPGGFPTVLYNCSRLVELDISQNYFVGPLPDDIDRLANLRYLDVSGNNFSGDIPPAIGRLQSLEILLLAMNSFNGTFPSEIGNLSNLRTLGMPYNDFSPALIPPEFGKLSKLETLWMARANLIGEIPESFVNLASLTELDLSMNDLSGSIPPGLFMLKNLSVLLLYKNILSGPLPSFVESVDLTQIDLSMNKLNGSIPEDFGKLQQLEILHLYSNQLSGYVPSSIALIPTLKNFRVFMNNLSGELPPEFGLHSKLEAFEVAQNQFTGSLPENLCAGGTLYGVVAFTNNLSGAIPSSLTSCDSLHTIQLYRNNFSGVVPLGLWTLANLTSLMLSENSFSGNLPSRMAWNLSRVEISNNKFSGQIPSVNSSTWANLIVIEASNNLFSGEIPLELTSLSELTTLSLDGNALSGQLPSQIMSWKSLNMLHLARNQLSGPIPPSLGSLPDLLDLDLSGNQLSGRIPPELTQLRLTSLNLSSNKLTGKIPSSFDNMAYDNSFLNNVNLCATSRTSSLPSCYSESPNSKKIPSRIFQVVLVLATVVFTVIFLFSVFLVMQCARKKHKHDITTWRLTSFQKLDFTEAKILSSLTEENMIGCGGSGKVYQIGIGRPGDYVAVKRIWNDRKLDKTLEKEFHAEVQILGSIRHSNIVKLLCCVSCENSKLLVYEYMENHSLDKWVHLKKRKMSVFRLSWPTRLQIAVGAARGLCYMHHDCFPPIIHRDVKSSNILLDSEFQARIADFGLAKILAEHKIGDEPNTMSAIAGSFGYIAPEYAYTIKANEKIDVYSFGVVLLELVTGKEPISENGDMSLAEWAWMHYAGEKSILDALDDEIKEPSCYIEEINNVFKLGLACTSMEPSSRPSMKQVLEILQRCSLPEVSMENKSETEYDFAPLLERESYIQSYKQGRVVDEGGFGLIYSV